jgi:tetratricopeptide (TPR) repeat protein
VAWLWAATSGHYDLLRRAASTFWYYHALRLLLHEGEALFSLALQALAGQQLSDQETGALQRVVKGCLQANRGWFRARVGHCAEARLEIEQAIASLRCEQDRAVLADALHHLSVVEWLSASFTKAQEYAHEALALNRALARDWHVALCLTSLGSTFYLAQDFAQSLTYFEEALEIMRRLGEPRSIALAIVTVGATTRALGRLTEAKTLLQEGLIRAAQLDDGWTTALIHQSMGLIADAEDEPEVARQLLERALHFFQERHDAWFSVDTLNALGWLHHKAGRPEDAWQSFADALQLAGKAEAMPGILSALVGLATMQAQTAPDGLQLIIIEHALTHPASTKETKDHAAKLRCELQIAFSPQQVEAAQAQAKSATLAGLVAEILTD